MEHRHKICYCHVHGAMAAVQNKANFASVIPVNRYGLPRDSPPAIPPHRNVSTSHHQHQHHHHQHQHSRNHEVPVSSMMSQPEMHYLNNFLYAATTLDPQGVRQRRHHSRQKSDQPDHLKQVDTQKPRSGCNHNHHHHHGHHQHQHDVPSSGNNPSGQGSSSSTTHHRSRHRSRHTAIHQKHLEHHKSAPSSPVSHHRSRIESNSTSQLIQNEEVPSRTSSGKLSGKSRTKKSNYFIEESPAHLPILSRDGSATPVSRHVTTGCCVSMSVQRLTRNRRPLSGSYSALDTLSNASDDCDALGSIIADEKKRHVHVSDCVKNFVTWMGRGTTAFIDALPSLKEDHHVVMVGLDSAGKTTVLYRLKFDQYVNTVPTIGFNCERVRGFVGRSRNLTFLVWDVGGQEKIRPLWKPYTRATDGIIFVVDSCETSDRMEEARLELHRIMRTPDNKGVPLLVIANKQDLPASRSTGEIEKELELHDLGAGQLWHIEAACAVTGEGLDVGLEALLQLIVKRKKIGKRARNKTR